MFLLLLSLTHRTSPIQSPPKLSHWNGPWQSRSDSDFIIEVHQTNCTMFAWPTQWRQWILSSPKETGTWRIMSAGSRAPWSTLRLSTDSLHHPHPICFKCWFWHELLFRDDPSVATEYECERDPGSQSIDDNKAGWDSQIFRDDKVIYRDDPEPDRDEDDDVFLFKCL